MRRRDRFLSVVAVLIVIGAIKLGQQLYRYYAYAEERVEIVRLEDEVDYEGLGVIETQLEAEELRAEIEAADARLHAARQQLDRMERQLLHGSVTVEAERAYRSDLMRYNEEVDRRNELFQKWQETVGANHTHVDRYNLLVDSIRTLATVMGEPYYPILSPAEIAVRHELGSAE